ncbi:NitT/TauT family transport system ATP-binding protein [Eubacterium aggregans]|uniref:ABC-type quaternary amine transporter n=2 Tax=Eubacterium aggregans TaxID=81409 RepID=A0A1H4C777_9FIRM|nr:ABC transporter ATP-binding protein [Eubacterium aggregans]SEA56218.1 NitT/TauT family transport system ATP-binding protein [Eubacterium aggregans]
MFIEIENVFQSFGDGAGSPPVLENINLDIKQGELVCLLGPSGCGKSTLLNIVAGFIKAEEGSVRIEGEVVTAPAINRLVIFQDYGLLPWRTVGQNVALGLEVKKVTRAEQNIMITKYLKMVGLEDARDRFPHQLSGGMQQRAAIARALAVQPEILLMDEPFGALDAITRMKLQEDILTLCRETGTTILFVTHDIEEAVYLADRIVILSANPGRIHAVLDVEMPHLRERTSDDFVLMRDRVFKAINLKHEHPLEYYL